MAKKVFINCPYDTEYNEFFKVLVFLCAYFGCEPMFASADKTTKARINKIMELIKDTDFGIHDLSRIELSDGKYPRFNMPFELGMDVMFCSENNQERKLLVLDGESRSYERTISDLKFTDIEGHKNSISNVFKIVRDFFVSTCDLKEIKSASAIQKSYKLAFKSWLAENLKSNDFEEDEEIEMFEFKQKTMDYFKINQDAKGLSQ